VGKALCDSEIAQWVEHYGIMGSLDSRAGLDKLPL